MSLVTEQHSVRNPRAGNQGLAVVDVRDIAVAISLTEEGHNGKTCDLVSSEALRGPDAAATWSKLLRKEFAYAGHADFDGFKAQVRQRTRRIWSTQTKALCPFERPCAAPFDAAALVLSLRV